MRNYQFFRFFHDALLILAEKHEIIWSGVEEFTTSFFRANSVLGFTNGTSVEEKWRR